MDKDVALVNLVLAEVGDVLGTDIREGLVVVGYLIGDLIGDLERLTQDDGIGIDRAAPAYEVPFQLGRLAEFLIGQLCTHGACADKECSE